MNGQEIQAYLGRWYDIVGQHHGGGGRGRWGGRWHHRGYPYGGFGYPYGGYGVYDAGGVEGDGADASAAWMAYAQQPAMMAAQQAAQQATQQAAQQGSPPAASPGGAGAAPAGSAQAQAVSGWYDIAGLGGGHHGGPLAARAAVVDAPLPTQANRDILPMSTGVPILPTQSAQITGRPQTLVFKIGRFVISNAGTAGGAADWIVNDIKIGNRSQFVQSGDVPGDLFATNAIDTFVRFESAQTAMDVVVVVTYIGLNESGCPFFGAMVGTAAV
jgi:hypothetical protein